MIRDKWLSIFAGVLAVAAACFLGIAIYIFINSGSGSENGVAGDLADADENVTAQEAAGADVAAAGENDAGAGADTEAELVADGEKADDDGSAPGENVPAIPILQVENVHEEGDNGGCTMITASIRAARMGITGTAVLTGSVNGGVYAGTENEYWQYVVLQSSEPDGILFGGESATRWKVSAAGMLTE